MTTTTAPIAIPATGLTHTAGPVTVTVIPTAQAGYRIQVRIAGVFNADLSSGHVFETDALRAYRTLVAQYPATLEPTPAAVKLAAVAKGTATKVSDPAHTALAVAAINGWIARGGQIGQASVTLINSLAKRGYVTRTIEMQGLRKVVTGAVITGPGRIRLAELTKADAEAAERAAAIAKVLAYTIAA